MQIIECNCEISNNKTHLKDLYFHFYNSFLIVKKINIVL